MTNAPAFTTWLNEFFAAYYRRRPVNATFIGVHDYDERLPDFSEAACDELASELDSLLRRLSELPDEPLTTIEAMDRELARGFLEIQRWEHVSGHFQHGNPCLYTGEAVFGVIALFLRAFAPLPQRVEAAISRMDGIPLLLEQARTNVRQSPVAWTERAIRECIGAQAFFLRGIDTLIQQHGMGDMRLRQAADRAAHAFADFQHYLHTELLRRPTDTVSCGDAAFALLLRSGHFLQQDASALESAAQVEFDESAAYLTEHARDFGAATPQAALVQLADLHPSVEGYYARYAELWEASRATALRHDLLTWPDFPVRYVSQPEWAREAAPYLYFLFYRAPAAFDRLPITDYLVTPITPDMPPDVQQDKLRATNDSVIKLNHVVHHGGIGHHVQNWHAMRSPSRIGQIAAVDCASRIAMFCGGTMAEGWACYASELMDEVGFLTPLEHYAERHARLRMAARTLVDVRLHHRVYSLEQAAAFYRDHVGMTDGAAMGEAVKNSMFPGTATMYLAGTDLIHELRHELAARYGATFNLRQFHDRLLSYGSVPVSLVGSILRKEALIGDVAVKGGYTPIDIA